MASAGQRRHYVTLTTRSKNAVTFVPPDLWVRLVPSAPGAFDERVNVFTVESPYHAQVDTHTVLNYEGRQLLVKGVQVVDEKNVDMVLFCEEVKTPA